MSRAYSADRARAVSLFVVLVVALAGAALGALSVGRYGLSVAEILRFLAARETRRARCGARRSAAQHHRGHPAAAHPLAAGVIGASLSVAGAAYQSVFRNPLASPALLGALGGASFGAALALVLGLAFAAVQGFAFLGGVGAVALGVTVANLFGETSTITLISRHDLRRLLHRRAVARQIRRGPL